MPSALTCRGLVRSFDGVRAVDGFDLDVAQGSSVSLLGPSGCGKSTVLRLIAGLDRPEAGSIAVRGRTVSDDSTWVPTERRRVGMVFQEWALFPHMDVAANIAFGLDGDASARVTAMLELAQLHGLAHRMPHELSGGQQQRVALARALAPGPDVVLLDEPFSNLDATLRAEVRGQVREILAVTNTTAVFVTHDREEALSISHKVALMVDGAIRQVGPPSEVYERPIDAHVARLVGPANLIAGAIEAGRVSSPFGDVAAEGLADGPCDLLIRPESIEVVADDDGEAEVVAAEFYGHDQLVVCRLSDGLTIEVRLNGSRPEISIGRRVGLRLLEAPLPLPR